MRVRHCTARFFSAYTFALLVLDPWCTRCSWSSPELDQQVMCARGHNDVNAAAFHCKRVSGMHAKMIGCKCRSHLGSFGVSGSLALQPMYSLSGGQKSRVAFAKVTFSKPHILLLDEPSNHLDLDAVRALIQVWSLHPMSFLGKPLVGLSAELSFMFNGLLRMYA